MAYHPWNVSEDLFVSTIEIQSLCAIWKVRKKRFGKKAGKKIPVTVGMFVLWMVMGIWHGGMKYLVGVSLWYWLLLTLRD